MGSFSERRGNAGAFAAITAKRIQEVKNWLVLEVATQSGAFWEQVRETRARWDVQALTKLPPNGSILLYPERLRRSQAEDPEQYATTAITGTETLVGSPRGWRSQVWRDTAKMSTGGPLCRHWSSISRPWTPC